MNCKEAQNTLYEKKPEELTAEEKKRILEHIDKCSDCKLIAEKNKAVDKILNTIVSFKPAITNPDLILENIKQKIELLEREKQNKAGIVNNIISYVESPRIRFSLAAFLFLILSGYFIQEFSAVSNIIGLEKKFNRISAQNYQRSQFISQDFGAFGLIYKLYKFVNNDSDFVEISKNVVLIKKDQLKALFACYENLDEAQKQRINALKKELFGSQSIISNPGVFSGQNITIDKSKYETAVKKLKAEGVKNEK
jgi:Zn-finger protein